MALLKALADSGEVTQTQLAAGFARVEVRRGGQGGRGASQGAPTRAGPPPPGSPAAAVPGGAWPWRP